MLLRRTLQVAVVIYIPFYTVALFVKGCQRWRPTLFMCPQSEMPLSVRGMPKALIVNDAVAHKKYPFSVFQPEQFCHVKENS